MCLFLYGCTGPNVCFSSFVNVLKPTRLYCLLYRRVARETRIFDRKTIRACAGTLAGIWFSFYCNSYPICLRFGLFIRYYYIKHKKLWKTTFNWNLTIFLSKPHNFFDAAFSFFVPEGLACLEIFQIIYGSLVILPPNYFSYLELCYLSWNYLYRCKRFTNLYTRQPFPSFKLIFARGELTSIGSEWLWEISVTVESLQQ